MLLAEFSFTSPYFVIFLLCALGLALGALYFRAGERVEDIKRELIDFMQWLQSEGFEHCPELVKDIIVSDASGAFKRLMQWMKSIKDPVVRKTILLEFLKKQLVKRLAEEESRAAIYKVIKEHEVQENARRQAVLDEEAAKKAPKPIGS